MNKEILPEMSPVAATVSPGGRSYTQQAGGETNLADFPAVGESLKKFLNSEMNVRNQFLQSETYSPSIADVPARDSSPEDSLNPLQQWGDWVSQQVADPCPLNLPQPIEALQCLGVVQKPGDQQLLGEQPKQGGWPQPPNVQPLGINLQPGWGLQQLGGHKSSGEPSRKPVRSCLRRPGTPTLKRGGVPV